jgi:predicted HicB family RNase H-like nuclease
MKLRYRDYTTILKRNHDGVWHGQVAGIQDVVTFEATSPTEAKQEFRKSIDAYLSFCQTIGQAPDEPVFKVIASRHWHKLVRFKRRIAFRRLKLRQEVE